MPHITQIVFKIFFHCRLIYIYRFINIFLKTNFRYLIAKSLAHWPYFIFNLQYIKKKLLLQYNFFCRYNVHAFTSIILHIFLFIYSPEHYTKQQFPSFNLKIASSLVAGHNLQSSENRLKKKMLNIFCTALGSWLKMSRITYLMSSKNS